MQNLYMKSHSGITTTMTEIRLRYWVSNLKRMMKSIVFNCITCRAYLKALMGQVMGKFPTERIKVAP